MKLAPLELRLGTTNSCFVCEHDTIDVTNGEGEATRTSFSFVFFSFSYSFFLQEFATYPSFIPVLLNSHFRFFNLRVKFNCLFPLWSVGAGWRIGSEVMSRIQHRCLLGLLAIDKTACTMPLCVLLSTSLQLLSDGFLHPWMNHGLGDNDMQLPTSKF